MDGAGLIRRLSSGPARVCGLVAGGLGLVVALTAAVPPSGAQHGAAPHNRSTALGNFLTSVSAVSASDAWAVGNAPGLALHWNGTRWVRTAIPHSSSLSALNGVSALSASDAWAVGALGDVSTTTLALHWNGTAWARVLTPSPGRFTGLTSVSAASPADAWAVGVNPALALRWNGMAWTQVAVPHPPGSSLLGVSTLSPTDAWAVGNHVANHTARTLVLHWNGTAWAQVTSPNVDGNGVLLGVAALSPTDAWAVGNYTAGNDIKTLVLHWNGTAWVHVPTPSPGRSPLNDSLSGVSVLSPSDAWAVGASGHGHSPFSPQNTLVLHWNGTAWARVASPSPGRSPLNDSLSGVSVLSASDAWAVGASGHGHSVFSPQKTLVLHWNGTRWTQVPAPSPRGTGTSPFTVLTGVSARSPGDAWAVGCACTNDFDTTLVLHWNGTAWARS